MGVGRTSSTGLPWLVASSDLTNGSDIIYPTSVAGSGVTLSGGQVSFSAATAVSVNGCFTAAYDNYRLVFTATLGSGGAGLTIRMRNAGSDDSTSNYAYQYIDAGSTTVTAARATSQSSMQAAAANAGGGWNALDLFSPALASPTFFLTLCSNPVTNPSATYYAGGHNVSSAFDGLSIITPSSSITGKLRIYGLRNS